MATMYGADVTQLEDLAKALSAAADRIDSLRTAVSHRIQVQFWVGPVAMRFRLAWDSQYTRMLHAAAEDLRGAAREANQNANEQRKASLAGTTLAGTSNWVAQLPRTSEAQDQSLERANPHYYDNQDFWANLLGYSNKTPKEWSNNCGYASIAYEMRRRGYAVSAAQDTDGDTYDDLASAFHDPKTGQPREWTHTGTKEATVQAMEGFGPGARGMVTIQWKDGGGHCFIVENDGGTVRFLDPQSGREDKSVADYFSRIEPGAVELLRVDDQEPTMNDMVVANNE